MQTFTTGNHRVSIAGTSSSRICYVLYPFDIPGDWIKPAAERFGISVAVVTGMDWDNDLTFELVPGNHYQYGEQHLQRAFHHMFG